MTLPVRYSSYRQRVLPLNTSFVYLRAYASPAGAVPVAACLADTLDEVERLVEEAASEVNEVGAKGHGRTVTCLDSEGEPVAAIAYHLDIDANTPLLVTAIVVIDVGTSHEQEFSRAMAAVLLCYLARAADERQLPPRLGFAPSQSGEPLAERLGFKRTAAPPAYRDAGDRYREWTPPAPIVKG